MKKLNVMVILAVAIFLMAGSMAQAEIQKVGTLNIRLVFDNYEKTKAYDKVLEDQYTVYESARNAKVEEVQEKQGKLSLLKDDEKSKAEEELKNLIETLQQYDREQQTDLTKKRDERIREIMLEVEQFVDGYAKGQNFDLILNSNVLIWQGEQVVDISEDVTEALNKEYKDKK
jgi:Skp family chaperone for outer membrane proteins